VSIQLPKFVVNKSVWVSQAKLEQLGMGYVMVMLVWLMDSWTKLMIGLHCCKSVQVVLMRDQLPLKLKKLGLKL